MSDLIPGFTEADGATETADSRPATDDDVTILWDGRRIDTREKALAFIAELKDADIARRTAAPSR